MKAQLRYLRISPRKIRLVADLIRGKDVKQAEHILSFTPKRSTQPITKLLKSAVSNSNNQEGLYISEIKVDQGPTLKRWRARAFGRTAEIKKRTSHISIKLESKDGTES